MEIDNKQKQTEETFNFKWKKIETYDSTATRKHTYNWEVKKYFETEENKEKFFRTYWNKKVLDAGCGKGFSAEVLFSNHLKNFFYTGIDISDAVWIAKKRLTKLVNNNKRLKFLKENIQTMKLKEQFDLIFSEGVIHHTSDPYLTFKNLVMHLKKGGRIMFYVYKKKAPIREFTDDFVRNYLKDLTNEEAWEQLKSLTKLGKLLGELNVKLNIEEDIEVLGIKKGQYSLHRFFYWYIAKIFYRPDYSLDEMNHVNFDWYRPQNCYRFTPEEIKSWLYKNNLSIERFYVEESGISVIAKKNI